MGGDILTGVALGCSGGQHPWQRKRRAYERAVHPFGGPPLARSFLLYKSALLRSSQH